MKETEKDTENELLIINQPKVYLARWMVLVSFCLFAFTNAASFVTYVPIVGTVEAYYNITLQQTIFTVNIYLFIYIGLGFFILKPIEYNMHMSFIITVSLNTIGCWVRYWGKNSYSICLIGCSLMGIASIIPTMGSVFVVDRWFPAHQRQFATSAMIFSGYLGNSLGYLFPCYYVQSTDDMESYLFILAIITTIPLPFNAIFMQSRPPTPASYSSATPKIDIYQSIKDCILIGQNLMRILSVAIIQALLWTIVTVIGNIMANYNYQPLTIGYFGLAINICGLFSGIIISQIIDSQIKQFKIPSYDYYIKILSVVTFIMLATLGLFFALDNSVNNPIAIILGALSGFGITAFTPIGAQSLMEILFPNHQLGVMFFMFFCASALSIVGNTISTLEIVGNYGLFVLLAYISPFIVYLVSFYKTDMSRCRLEQSKHDPENHSQNYSRKSKAALGFSQQKPSITQNLSNLEKSINHGNQENEDD